MGVCVDDVLASVRGVVDLSPQEALDEAQDFLTRQGYSVTYRTTTTLTVTRQGSDHATGQESIFKLIVMALPQSGGGVQINVRGNDREAAERLRDGPLDAAPRNRKQPRDPGVWTGVKLGCGMFIVLPIIIFVVIIVLIIFIGAIGGSGG